jgi:pimeloyl-ACP methyl ester carboxylesterase
MYKKIGKSLFCGVFIVAFIAWWSIVVGSFSAIVPDRVVLDNQTKYLDGARMEYVTFSSKAGSECKPIDRHGILVRVPNAKATILVCHGFMCNKFDVSFIPYLLFPQYNVLTFDFRAHGENVDPEDCCTFGRDEALDVAGAVEYIRAQEDLKDLPLLAYGFSMGAVAAIQAQSEAERNKQRFFDAMVLDCPYDSSENVLKRCMQHLKFSILGYTFDIPGKKFLERYAFNSYVQSILKSILKTVAQMNATATNTYIYPFSPAESIKDVTVPCFFIHCYNDEKVSVEAAHRLFDNACGYKRLWITKGRWHFDSIFFNPKKYVYKVRVFINDVLSGNVRSKPQQKILSDIKQ